MNRGGTSFGYTKGVKLTDIARSLRNKLFHKKCVPFHKMQIPNKVEHYYACHVSITQTVPLTWLWMILNNLNILNFIILVSANNCTVRHNNYICQCQ
jgi:hypothetical protein